MYTKDGCDHCIQAKSWLDYHNVDYREINISEDIAAREFVVGQGHRTVPQIYYDTGMAHKLLVEGGNAGLQALDIDGLMSRIDEVSVFSLDDLGDI